MSSPRDFLKRIVKPAYRLAQARLSNTWFLRYESSASDRKALVDTGDPVRYGAFALAVRALDQLKIDGAIAECGVYKGTAARIIHAWSPGRTYYLFDTFEGFPESDLEGRRDKRFRDTSLEAVKRNIGDLRNLVFRPGYFPQSAEGLEGELFALVILDFDLYNPTAAALEFFYPRLAPGGYMFIHDYSSPESDRAVSRAVDAFFKDRPEKLTYLPDACGTVVIGKQ